MSCSCWSRSSGHLVFWGSYLCFIGCSLRVGTFLPLATDAFVVFSPFSASHALMLVFVCENSFFNGLWLLIFFEFCERAYSISPYRIPLYVFWG